MNGKRILFILNVDWFFVSHRLPIARELIAQGYEVHIATTITDKRELLEQEGLIVHPTKIRRGSKNPFDLYRSFSDLLRIIRDVQPDILHLITPKAVILGGIAARVAKLPRVVIAISGLGSTFVGQNIRATFQRKVIEFLYRQALRQKKLKVIFQNLNDKEIIQDISRLHDDEMEVLTGSGVDLTQFRSDPVKGDIPIIMFAGRLLHEKGVLEFVETARRFRSNLNKPDKSPKFALVGMPDPDNPSSVTATEIEGWVNEGAIEYWGHINDMPSALSQASVFIYPSYYGEGLAKVLLEAAAAGRAVITTDKPGCREAIIDGETGILVPTKNVPAIVEALEKLLNDPDTRHEMGHAGRKLAEQKFDIKLIVKKHMDIYSDLLRD